jgi:acyl-CoA dehydrogenase
MKLFACRALDYLQKSCLADRRYLLWNAVQKAKVSTEGVKVLALLSECIGARGVEAETYFEMALRDAQLIPGLEGSTHINFALAAQFLDPYLAGTVDGAPLVESLRGSGTEPNENPYWFGPRDRHAATVRFAPFLAAYEPLRLVANVRRFMKQAEAFRQFAADSVAARNQAVDAGLTIGVGKCLALLAYGQLVAENCRAAHVAPATVAIIFHSLIEDLSAEALKLASMFAQGTVPRAQLRRVVCVPSWNHANLDSVFGIITTRYGPSET